MNKPLKSIKEEVVVLGIDPGTHRMGYGIISVKGSSMNYLNCGVIEVRETSPQVQLLSLHKELSAVIAKHRPNIVGIEKLFFTKNQKTAMSVAEARGIALLAAAEAGTPVVEIAPNLAKQYVTGYGGADKKAMTKMVKLVLKIDDLKVLDDATDALGIAIAAAFIK